MLHITTELRKEIVLVAVPKNAYGFVVKKAADERENYLEYQVFPLRAMYWEGLPEGDWINHGLCNEVSEDVCRDLVHFTPYKNAGYYRNYEHYKAILFTARESFFSFLKSKGLSEGETILLVRK